MRKLLQGIINFRKFSLTDYRDKFSRLATQHAPDALLVACCDSRVVPNVFASSDPGDLFVLRNIGNLIPKYKEEYLDDASVGSAIEFSLTTLNVSDIIICGHSDCGAMQSLLEKDNKAVSLPPSLNKWLMTNAISSYNRFKNSQFNNESSLTPCNCLSRINVLQQLDNLKTYPLVIKRLINNKLKIHGWWFDLATADVYYYNASYGKFIVINEEQIKNILQA